MTVSFKAVVALPIAKIGIRPPLNDKTLTWSNGPLSCLTERGAPATNVFAQMQGELPGKLQAPLLDINAFGVPLDPPQRAHVAVFDKPLPVPHGIDIVALECWQSPDPYMSDFLIFHLRGTANSTSLAYLNSITRLNTMDSKQFLRSHIQMAAANLLASRGISLVLLEDSNESPETWTSDDLVITYTRPASTEQELFLRGRLTSVLLLISIQQAGLNFVTQVNVINDSMRDEREARSWFNDFDAKYGWPVIMLNEAAQGLYEFLQHRLGIDRKLAQLRVEFATSYEREQAESAAKLNRVGAVVAVSTVLSGWLSVAGVVSSPFAIVGVLVTGVALLVAVNGNRWKK